MTEHLSLISLLSTGALAAWLAVPLSFLAFALYSHGKGGREGLQQRWHRAETLLVAGLGVSMLVGLLMMAGHWLPGLSMVDAGRPLGLYATGFSGWMAVMVSFIGWVILRYARDYLRGDPVQVTFLPWFLTTLACVLILVFTSHLLVLAAAWIGVSLSLHQLLTLYPDRPQARLAAAQKFIASRLGDACVIGGVWLIGRHYGTFNLQDIAQAGAAAVSGNPGLQLASVLLAIAAALKCAQLPFHGWLLRVMEAPTPVSALLHAGIINLGGFLWLRLNPMFDGFTLGHGVLLVVGGATAVVAVLTMMTQASVKHALAWSTIAQMGFMLFEIGLGAYTLAALHLLAHSLYKAHSFLAAGRTVRVAASLPVGPRKPWLAISHALVTGVVAAALLALFPSLTGGSAVLSGLLVLAIVNGVWGIPLAISRKRRAVLSLLALALIPLYGLLHLLLGPALGDVQALPLPAPLAVFAWMVPVALALLSWPLLQAGDRPAALRLRVLFAQGLYLDRPFEQLTRRLASRALNAPTSGRHYLTGHRLTTGEPS
ncbi:NADH-quinone oxidoreductase subunit L [Marinobacter sp. C2H3]|uniref:NADH-quinone oxidoreductase subunit L n=1 Tax=Marinobacter sp. C2H3 TaxID=3119003 RepID=UPI00300E8DE7